MARSKVKGGGTKKVCLPAAKVRSMSKSQRQSVVRAKRKAAAAGKYKRSSKRGSYRNPYLSEGDLIIVGNSFLSNSTEFLKEVTAPFQGLYSTYSLIDALYN